MGRFEKSVLAGVALTGLVACGTPQLNTPSVDQAQPNVSAPTSGFSTQYYVRPMYANFFGYRPAFAPYTYNYGLSFPYSNGFGFPYSYGYGSYAFRSPYTYGFFY